MILTFRHRDSRSNQKYDGNINIALSSGVPTSIREVRGKGNITSNIEYLLLPIDCVLAGQQKEEKKGPDYIVDLHAILKKIIYRE